MITIEETTDIYDISRVHLMKVVNQFTRAGFMKVVRGRPGELPLAEYPERINLGDVLRTMELDFALVECFNKVNRCVLTPHCRLRGVMHEALAAFSGTLDRYTLADLILGLEDFGLQPAE